MQTANSLKDSLYADCNDSVLTTDTFVEGMKNSEIEDLFPVDLLTGIIGKIERRADQDFEGHYKSGLPVVPQIKAWAENEGFELARDWKVQLAIKTKVKLLANPVRYADADKLKQWAVMFKKFG